MQAKDIPVGPILEFLQKRRGQWTLYFGPEFGKDHPDDLSHAMPVGTPWKVGLAKMRSLFKQGLVSGCPCGCRGDWEITQKGLEYLENHD